MHLQPRFAGHPANKLQKYVKKAVYAISHPYFFTFTPFESFQIYIFFRDNRATIHKNKKEDDCNRPVLVYGRPVFRLLINPLKAQLFFLVYYPMINVTGIFGKRNSNFKKRARVRSKWECIVFPLNLGKSIFSRPV